MMLTPQQLDDIYTDLCYRMARAGDSAAAPILARLTLLLMHEVGDAEQIRQAMDEAMREFPAVVTLESPH